MTQSKFNFAQIVAVATPCCPAPVSAIILFLPNFFANNACPTVLFILCAPVWFRSSLLNQTFGPPKLFVKVSAKYNGDGLPT